MQADGKIVVTGGTDNATGFYTARFDTAGNLDGTFGVGGVVPTQNPVPASLPVSPSRGTARSWSWGVGPPQHRQRVCYDPVSRIGAFDAGSHRDAPGSLHARWLQSFDAESRSKNWLHKPIVANGVDRHPSLHARLNAAHNPRARSTVVCTRLQPGMARIQCSQPAIKLARRDRSSLNVFVIYPTNGDSSMLLLFDSIWTRPNRSSSSRRRFHRPRLKCLEQRNLLSGAGSLDPTFGGGGIVTTSIKGKDANVWSLLQQPDGKLVAIGVGMARYNTSGTLDNSFGSKGLVSTAGGVGALYPDGTSNAGKIVTGTSVSTRTTGSFSLARYNTNGSLDATFGSKGTVSTPFGKSVTVNAVAVQTDGKVVAGGGTDNDLALARYDANGSLDMSFGSGGKVVTEAGGHYQESLNAMTLQADGKIVAAGESDGQFVVVRYNTDGTPDTSFGLAHTGIVLVSAGGDANAVAIQTDGRILVGGYDDYARTGDYQRWGLARLNPDGTLDGSFGDGGVIKTQVTASPDGSYSIMALAVQADGKILAAGNTDGGLTLVRYDASGTLDSTFGIGGVVTTSVPSSSYTETHAVLIQPDGKLVVGGKAEIGKNSQMALARYLGDGAAGASLKTPSNVTSGQPTSSNEISMAALPIENSPSLLSGTPFSRSKRFTAN